MFRRFLITLITISFISSSLQPVWAQPAEVLTVNQLPVPGTMVERSGAFVPVLLKGLVIHADQPFNFDFIVDSGNDSPDKDNIREQSKRMIRYFLTALTEPSNDLWVNLSPYEKDRIITNELGQTDMGRDMLSQDYVLKQLTASLIYPEKDLGKAFWARVYKKVEAKTGNTNIPINTFNKVWIMPDGADIFENPNAGPGKSAVYITKSHLKVMLEEDYLSLKKHSIMASSSSDVIARSEATKQSLATHSVASQIVRDIVLPEIEKEVNEGANFALLRQVYSAAILAKWYRETVANSLMAKVYFDKKKIAGVDLDDKTIKEQIYQRYITAYKKGVFNYIKEDNDTFTGQVVPRKYFSGGETMAMASIFVRPVSRKDFLKAGARLFTGMLLAVQSSCEMSGVEMPGIRKIRITNTQEGFDKLMADSAFELNLEHDPRSAERSSQMNLVIQFIRMNGANGVQFALNYINRPGNVIELPKTDTEHAIADRVKMAVYAVVAATRNSNVGRGVTAWEQIEIDHALSRAMLSIGQSLAKFTPSAGTLAILVNKVKLKVSRNFPNIRRLLGVAEAALLMAAITSCAGTYELEQPNNATPIPAYSSGNSTSSNQGLSGLTIGQLAKRAAFASRNPTEVYGTAEYRELVSRPTAELVNFLLTHHNLGEFEKWDSGAIGEQHRKDALEQIAGVISEYAQYEAARKYWGLSSTYDDTPQHSELGQKWNDIFTSRAMAAVNLEEDSFLPKDSNIKDGTILYAFIINRLRGTRRLDLTDEYLYEVSEIVSEQAHKNHDRDLFVLLAVTTYLIEMDTVLEREEALTRTKVAFARLGDISKNTGEAIERAIEPFIKPDGSSAMTAVVGPGDKGSVEGNGWHVFSFSKESRSRKIHMRIMPGEDVQYWEGLDRQEPETLPTLKAGDFLVWDGVHWPSIYTPQNFDISNRWSAITFSTNGSRIDFKRTEESQFVKSEQRVTIQALAKLKSDIGTWLEEHPPTEEIRWDKVVARTNSLRDFITSHLVKIPRIGWDISQYVVSDEDRITITVAGSHSVAIITNDQSEAIEPNIILHGISQGISSIMQRSPAMTVMDLQNVIPGPLDAKAITGENLMARSNFPKIPENVSPAQNGGIDLNSIDLNRHGHAVNMQFNAAQISQMESGDFPGFGITINSVTVIDSPLPELGLKNTGPRQMLAKV